MSDEVKNVNDPVSPQERDQWIANLSNEDKAELRRQQLLQAAITKAQPKVGPTDAEINRMTDQELKAYTMREFGF
jgi:hypothetical protein